MAAITKILGSRREANELVSATAKRERCEAEDAIRSEFFRLAMEAIYGDKPEAFDREDSDQYSEFREENT
jgi:hypothetical protein